MEEDEEVLTQDVDFNVTSLQDEAAMFGTAHDRVVLTTQPTINGADHDKAAGDVAARR